MIALTVYSQSDTYSFQRMAVGVDEIRRAQEGDDGAFGKLYESFEPPIRRYLGRMVPQQELDDLVSETFLRVLQSITELRNPHAFNAWLYTIAANQVNSFFRASDRQPRTEPLEGKEDFFSREDTDTERIVIGRLALRQTFGEIRRPDIFGHLFLLGHDREETAKQLGMSVAALDTSLCRERTRLREIQPDLLPD